MFMVTLNPDSAVQCWGLAFSNAQVWERELDTDTIQVEPDDIAGKASWIVGIAAEIQWCRPCGTLSNRESGHWEGMGVGAITPRL